MFTRGGRTGLMVAALLWGVGLAAQEVAKAPWWKHAVFYEIYPRSFADSNGDGVGDLNGIRGKLSYLNELGVDAIWISPCYPSPQKDFGYDVSDYESIDPMYGTLKDFDRLQGAAARAGIRMIMDFVPNHSSDQHQWFLDSKSALNAKHRDWYVWRDGKGAGKPPNNWESDFGGPAWTFDPGTKQWYYHYFEAAQPDLNWRNPAVQQAMFDVNRFWYRHGVAGFRLDAVDTLYEDPQLRDNPVRDNVNEFGDLEMINKYNDKLPENHQVLRELRKIADEHHAVLIGETWTDSIGELKEYYGAEDDELQLPMDFMFTTVNKLSAPLFRKQIGLLESAKEWPVYVITNHDLPRSYNRYGDGVHNDAIAKLMAGLYLTLRGTPIMYYGEELGMANNDPVRREDVKDPLGQAGWPKQKGRDGERTPMQWDAGLNAGFTTGKPWLPIPASYSTHNVEAELKDSASVLMFYKQLLQLRRSTPALLDGEYMPLHGEDASVLAYVRRTGGSAVLVVLNMSGGAVEFTPGLSGTGFEMSTRKTLLTSMAGGVSLAGSGSVRMEPFSVYIAQLVR